MNDVDVAIVGAGQAGLAIGYHLKRQGRRFVILERAGQVAPAWRERWDSLTLFTSRRYSSLPGLPFPGDPDGYAGREEVIAYLERYAETFELPMFTRMPVKNIVRTRFDRPNDTNGSVSPVVGSRPMTTPMCRNAVSTVVNVSPTATS